MKSSLLLTILIVFISACNSQEKEGNATYQSKRDFEEKMIASHKRFIEKSNQTIQNYIDSSAYSYITTGTGLRYAVIEAGAGVTPSKGNEVKIAYSIRFLDGEEVMGYNEPKVSSFFIEQSDVESGLHEALQLMKVGEKASFIFPPHLAFGISGDRNGIPPQSTLLYTIELIAAR